MKKILVIGGTGMVASRVIELISDKFEITSADEKILDITSQENINNYFQNNKFDVVMNFAAFTNVDGAESEKGKKDGIVYKLNTLGPKYLAEICRNKNAFLIHISTDFVFPGNEIVPGPYNEDTKIPDASDGIGWYGWTKNRAEIEVKNSEVRHAIIRYGYPFRATKFDAKNDWARNLIKLYNEHKLYPLFTDQVQSIIFIDDLSLSLSKIIENEFEGIFHVVSFDTVTPYEAGKYLLEKYSGKDVDLQKGSMVDFLNAPGRTPRPRLGGLNSLQTQKTLGLKFKTWKEMVDEFVEQLKS